MSFYWKQFQEEWQSLWQFLYDWKPEVTLVGVIILYVVAFIACAHILINKRDSRSSLGWVVVCLGFPGIGTVFYILFGINRIRTRAHDWQSLGIWEKSPLDFEKTGDLNSGLNLPEPQFTELKKITSQLFPVALRPHCSIKALHNGEQAYPEMLMAIHKAKDRIYLSTYIFETNDSGQEFIKALTEAKERGVDVKVIIDGFGSLYSFPSAASLLKKAGVSVKKFLPPSLSKRSLHVNLRNHRKLLIVDGRVAFTGGMNIGDRHKPSLDQKKKVKDIHFKVQGSVIEQMQNAFLEDWEFITGQKPDRIYYDQSAHGETLVRGLTAGPNQRLEPLRLLYASVLSSAQRSIKIMTPYFVPDASFVAALNAAALRGVKVEIILPKNNNIPYIRWACRALLWEVLRHDVKVYEEEGVFNHSKFLVIDDFYSLVGSANLDPRSLRLNFEFNLEVFDKVLGGELSQYFDEALQNSKPITMNELENRPFSHKVRDGVAKLFAPYL
jgi:cardiolipin synthase